MTDRPAIPAEIKRNILVEAGHRCAIQTCRSSADVDIHHIIPWEESKSHDPANLIALCPNCHRLANREKIDRKSLLKYKEICRKLTQPAQRRVESPVEAFIKFNPNTVTEIHTATNISSLNDNGVLDFTLTFDQPFDDATYVIQGLGSGSVGFTVLSQTRDSIRLKFSAPCPNIVRLEFRD